MADTTVSRGTEKQPVSDLTEYPRRVSWFWPDRDMNVTAVLNDTELTLTFTTNQPQNFQWFTLPDNTVSALYMPLGEGRHIPLNNEQWRHYMVTEQDNIDTNQDLQLPLWICSYRSGVSSRIGSTAGCYSARSITVCTLRKNSSACR